MQRFYRRKLPHLYALGASLFVTWRLHGSLPESRSFPSKMTGGQVFAAMDRLLDTARSGPVFLAQPEIARMICESIAHCAIEMYDLHAWVVMPNHVHLLITPKIEMPRITESLKGFTARRANRMLGLRGRFWQDESYDRLVRNNDEFRRIKNYIENNPVRAGLVARPEDYRWSSCGAGFQACAPPSKVAPEDEPDSAG